MMLDHRTLHIDERMLISTLLPYPTHLVRIFPSPTLPYNQMTNVSEIENGRELFLSGWIGSPLGIPWREAGEALFPDARFVNWVRRTQDGSERLVRVGI
jgi:hypothetical protein